MDTLVFDNDYLDGLFLQNSKEIETYIRIKKIAESYVHGYARLVYLIITLFSKRYMCITNIAHKLNYSKINDIVIKLKKYKKVATIHNIHIFKPYDKLNSHNLNEENFDVSSLCEFIYYNLLDVKDYMSINKETEDIIKSIVETINEVFNILNTSLCAYISKIEKRPKNNFVVYLEIVNDYLFITPIT